MSNETPGWKPRVRCPCCGRNATTYALGHAGTHRLETMRCTKALGWRYGFVWERGKLTGDLAGALVRGLARALVQVLGAARAPADLLALALPDLQHAVELVRDALELRSRREVVPAQTTYAPTSYAPTSYAPTRFAPTRMTPLRVRVEEEAA